MFVVIFRATVSAYYPDYNILFRFLMIVELDMTNSSACIVIVKYIY